MTVIPFPGSRRPRIAIEGGIDKSTQRPIWLLLYTDEENHSAYVGDSTNFNVAHAMAKQWERDGALLEVASP